MSEFLIASLQKKHTTSNYFFHSPLKKFFTTKYKSVILVHSDSAKKLFFEQPTFIASSPTQLYHFFHCLSDPMCIKTVLGAFYSLVAKTCWTHIRSLVDCCTSCCDMC